MLATVVRNALDLHASDQKPELREEAPGPARELQSICSAEIVEPYGQSQGARI